MRRRLCAHGIAILIGLLAGPLVLLAQQPPQRPAPGRPLQNAPQPLRRLAFLLGQWEEDVIYAGRAPEASRGKGRWLARPEMGRYLFVRYEGRGAEGPYQAMGMLTWEEKQQAYRMWWFDDAGSVGDYRGNFTDEDTLVLEHHSQVDGRDFRERLTYARAAPGEVRTRIEQAYGSEEYKLYLEANAKRGEGPLPRRPDAPRPPQN